jgi:glucose uptake protein
MWMPADYSTAFLMLLVSMVCWGSWANSLKMMKGCRFELFYWDYVAGTLAVSLVLAFTLGSSGTSGLPFLADLRNAPGSNLGYAFAGGVVFNAANMLLTGAIEVAGLAVAFPLGVGLSIVIGVVLNYLITAKNDPVLLFGGVTILLVAVILDALAFRAYSGQDAKKTSRTGIILCVVAGVGLGMFYPLVAKSISGPNHPGPYTVGVLFMLGMFLSNMIFNAAVMRRPITGQPPLPFSAYLGLPGRWHMLGFALGGGVWGLGTVFNFTASATGIVGPATSFALGNGAVMVSVIWGLLLWGEFRGASAHVKRLLTLMFLLFAAGLTSIALSPVISIVH